MWTKVFEILASFLMSTPNKIPGQECKSNISRLLRITRLCVKVAKWGLGGEVEVALGVGAMRQGTLGVSQPGLGLTLPTTAYTV